MEKKNESTSGQTNTLGSGEQLVSNDFRRGFIQGLTFRSKPVEFAVVDGKAIFEGDIVLGDADHVEYDVKPRSVILFVFGVKLP